MTKQEQVLVLRGAIRRLKTGDCTGLCSAIKREINHICAKIPEDIPTFTFEHIHELCEVNDLPLPVKAGILSFWWDPNDQATRIKVLNLLIEELK